MLVARKMSVLSRPRAFSLESQQAFDRMFTPPSDTRARVYADLLIDPLVASGVWSRLDGMYLYAGASEEAAFTNLRRAAFYSGRYDGGGGAVPDFVADQGFRAQNLIYISPFYKPASDGINYSTNSAMVCSYLLPAAQANPSIIGTDSGLVRLDPWRVPGDKSIFCLNSTATDEFSPVSAMGGFWMLNRTGANALSLLHDNQELAAVSRAATAAPSDFLFSVYGGPRCAFFAMGGGLMTGQMAALDGAVRATLTAIGAIN